MKILDDENRAWRRSSLPLALTVEVREDQQTCWTVPAKLKDTSKVGAGFVIGRELKRGQIVLLAIPMPAQLRIYSIAAADYKVWALTLRSIEITKYGGEPEFAVGAVYIGRTPPQSYERKPHRLFKLGSPPADEDSFWTAEPLEPDAPAEADERSELRKYTRLQIPEELLLVPVNETGDPEITELTITDNISRSGACVSTQLDLRAGDFVNVTSRRHSVTLLSIVRARNTGPDGIPRLHIEFIDGHVPLDYG